MKIGTLTVLVLLTAFASNVLAASVWKVEKDGAEFYVGGTLHMLSESDYPLPDEFKTAYDRTQLSVFETDIGAINSPSFQQKTFQLMAYNDGRTVKDDLSEKTFEALKGYLAKRGVPINNVLVFKPSLLYVTLTVIEMQYLGLTSIGVDQYFHDQSETDNKPVKWLESPDEQLHFLANIGGNDPDALISFTLDEMARVPETLNALKDAWRKGDMEAMEALALDDMQKDFPELYGDLIKTRNDNWMPHLIAMFDTPEKEFVLVGALHLAGPDSILAQLQSQGAKVTKVTL